MREIPESVLLYEILPRFPIKSLARFRLVCKQWNSTILSPEFVKTYFLLTSSSSRSVLATNNDAFFTAFDFGDYLDLYYTSFGQLFTNTATYLLDSCNGLALLICSNGESDDENLKLPDHLLHFDYDFVVYNPLLGRNFFVQIIHPLQFLVANNNKNIEVHDYNFGFGYVSSLDDYYIVAINFLSNPEIAVVIHGYSLKTREWRRKYKSKKFNMKFEDAWYNQSGILINENLHWGISFPFSVGEFQIKGYAIGVLDLAHFGNPNKHDFRTMRLPDTKIGGSETETGGSGFSVCSLDGQLCAWRKYDNGRDLDMWMMKEYGVHESWTRLFRLNLADFCGIGITNFFGFNSSDMAMILTYQHELILANCKCYPPLYTHYGFRNQVKAVNYVRSLISPLALSSV